MTKPLPLHEFIAWQSWSKLLHKLWPLQLLPPRHAIFAGVGLELGSSAQTGLAMKATATAAASIAPPVLFRMADPQLHDCVIGKSGLAQLPASSGAAGVTGMLKTSLGKHPGVGWGRGSPGLFGMVSNLSDRVTANPKHLPSGHGTSLFAQLVQIDWQSLNKGSVLLNWHVHVEFGLPGIPTGLQKLAGAHSFAFDVLKSVKKSA
jgi:hypothetical protein